MYYGHNNSRLSLFKNSLFADAPNEQDTLNLSVSQCSPGGSGENNATLHH